MKFLLTAIVLFVVYSLGFGRVLSLLDAADNAIKEAYDKAAPELHQTHTQRPGRGR